MITFDDFAKVELKVGTVLEAEDIEGSEKLIKLLIDLGEEKPRQILAGIKQWYKNPSLRSGTLPSAKAERKPKHSLVGTQVVVVANLEPRKMMGLESQGMILCADAGKPIILKPLSKVPVGTQIR